MSQLSTGLASTRRAFDAPGSPLDGRLFPADWFHLDFNGKRQALVNVGYANNYHHACSILGKHSGAVRRARKARADNHEKEVQQCWWNK